MRSFARVGPSLRGLRSRAGSSALIFAVAVVAVAGAVAGPVYYSAAQTSILRDSVASAPVVGRGYEVVQGGPIARGTAQLSSTIASLTVGYGRFFEPPISAVEATAFDTVDQVAIPLVSRTGVCGHLSFRGSCPSAAGQVMISTTLAAATGWGIGSAVTLAPWGVLHVTGVYSAPVPAGDYWFDRQGTYFPAEYPFAGRAKPPTTNDAMFTAPSTLSAAPGGAQGNLVVDSLLDQKALHPGDIAPLQSGITDLENSQELQAIQAVATSAIPQTASGIEQGWSSLAVPVLVITLQLLVLAWLVLFLLVGDAVAARGPDVALAKLRGFSVGRTALFGLAEPALTVVVALPLGCIAGWAAASALGDVLLRPGTPTGFPAIAFATGAAATAAGIAAVCVAATRTIRRPVLEQWRKADRTRRGRTWVLDVVLLTGAVAGLADLALGGQIDSAHHSALSLLVPGLLGLAVAVVASRLLPVLCRAVAATRAGAAPAAFLALRHVARRPGGARTTILLATSFALATFALSAWSVERSNYARAAALTVGAPAVLTVQVPAGQDLGAVVARADPSGKDAAGVDLYGGSGSATLAVDPARWLAVASWAGHRPRVAGLLDPPTAAPAVMGGDGVRVTVSVAQLSLPVTGLTLDVDTPTGEGVTPVQLGSLPQSGTASLSAPLPGCPCTIRDLTAVPDPSLGGSQRFTGRVTVTGFEVHDPSGWHPFDAGLFRAHTWRTPDPVAAQETVGSTSGGLAWSWSVAGVDDAVAAYADVPAIIPALAPATTTARTGRLTASGLDGQDLPVDVVTVAKAVPGLGTAGVVVDRRFAETAAGGNLAQVVQQVWVRGGRTAAVTFSLRRQGVDVLSVQTQQDTAAAFRRAGPGLAGVLFLAEAAAAALLAAAGAILGLSVSARRRRYEMASLEVTGIAVPTLVRSVVLEQVTVLAFGAAAGIGAGLAADALVLRVMPEFASAASASAPSAVLTYAPPAAFLTVVLLVAAGAVVAVAAAAGALLVRGTRLAQLREGVA